MITPCKSRLNNPPLGLITPGNDSDTDKKRAHGLRIVEVET